MMNDYKETIEYLRATANEMTAADVHAFGVDDVVVESEDAGMLRNAADAIEQLIKERDAAVDVLELICNSVSDSTEICNICKKDGTSSCYAGSCAWEWRGVKEDNDDKVD